LDDLPVTADEARDGLDDARDIVGIMSKFLPQLGPFR
jgi:hypothetical protein